METPTEANISGKCQECNNKEAELNYQDKVVCRECYLKEIGY
jgi:formylmethanofuran dehydrogenase subunit E